MHSSSQGCHTATGTHIPHGITQCYLPPGRGDIPALTPAEAGTRLSDPGDARLSWPSRRPSVCERCKRNVRNIDQLIRIEHLSSRPITQSTISELQPNCGSDMLLLVSVRRTDGQTNATVATHIQPVCHCLYFSAVRKAVTTVTGSATLR